MERGLGGTSSRAMSTDYRKLETDTHTQTDKHSSLFLKLRHLMEGSLRFNNILFIYFIP